jgi:drug/metabolite transporter (DMT)-like permease
VAVTSAFEARVGLSRAPRRGPAIILGLVVTALWASSVVLIRIGLDGEVDDPIGFAGIRFTLAAILLLPLAWPRLRVARGAWGRGRPLVAVVVYGTVMFGLNQIAIHVALGVVSASTMGLMIGLTPVFAALFAIPFARERATAPQFLGIAILVAGVAIFFGLEVPEADLLPMVLLAASAPVMVGAASLLGRRLALDIDRFGGAMGLSAMAMLAGGLFSLAVGLVVEGLPRLTVQGWILITWMAAINTAMAYTLWAQVQRTLRAVEASVLGDVTVLLTALLGWLVLGEALGLLEITGLALVVVGVVIVQATPVLRARAARA